MRAGGDGDGEAECGGWGGGVGEGWGAWLYSRGSAGCGEGINSRDGTADGWKDGGGTGRWGGSIGAGWSRGWWCSSVG